jgi:hypothetical protein
VRLLHSEFQLYDFISSKCLGSLPRPSKDAYFRYREIIDILRDIDDSYSFANNDTLLKRIVRELLDILTQPHFKVNLLPSYSIMWREIRSILAHGSI